MKSKPGAGYSFRLPSVAATIALMLFASASAAEKGTNQPHYELNVRALKVHQGDISSTLSVTGVVNAAQSQDIAFRVGGTVVERDVQTGDRVHQGQVLARLGTSELQASITSAEADVASARASLVLAQSDLDRQKSLLDKGFTTRSSFEQATKTLSVAQASLSIAESQLQIARDNFSYAELTAGADGVVISTSIEVGQVVQPGQTVMTLAAGDRKQAVFDVSESTLANAAMDSAVAVFLASNPSVKAKARFAEIAPNVNRLTGTVRIKVDLEDPPARMSLGAAVTGEGKSLPVKGFVLPYEALSKAGSRPAVWVIDPATGTVNLRPVELVFFQGQSMIVRGELHDGDLVVTAGAGLLSPGLKSSFTEENR